MEKYCIENADPDILLEELTEVKKELNPIPQLMIWKAPFPEVGKESKDETMEKTKMFDSMFNDARNSSQIQQDANSDLSETQKIML